MAELIHDETFVPNSNKGMDYGKAIGWYFSDPLFWSNMLKFSLLFLSVIFILPIFYVIPLFIGYMISISRNVQQGEYKLPEIGAEGQWKDGVLFWLISMAISLVFTVIYVIISLPLSFLTPFIDSEFGFVFAILSVIFAFVFQILYYVFLMYVSFSAQAIYAKTRSLNAVFNLDNIKYVVSKNKVSIVVSVLVIYAASFAFILGGILLLCIGILPATFLMYNLMATVIGQLDVDEVV